VERKSRSAGGAGARSRSDMMEWQKSRDEKIQRARQAKLEGELAELTPKITLNANSKKIVQRMPGMQSSTDVGIRLYEDFSARQERLAQLKEHVDAGRQQTQQCTFSPQIAKGSVKIINKQAHRTDVSTRLYSDAMRRKGSSSNSQPAEPVAVTAGNPVVVSQPASRLVPQQVREWMLMAEEDESGALWFLNTLTQERHPQYPAPTDPWKVFFESDSQTCFYHNSDTGDSHWGPAGVTLDEAPAVQQQQPEQEPELESSEEPSPPAHSEYPSCEYSMYEPEGCDSPIVWA